MSKAVWAERGDTAFTRSNSLLGRLIRWGEREKGEEAPWTNHALVIVEDGWLGEPDSWLHKEAVVVEALWKTRKGTWEGWKEGTDIRVFRPVPEYTEEEKSRFVADANHYVGDKYGYWKLGGFLIKRFTGINVPELFFIDNRPICSYLAAKVNDAARKINLRIGGWLGFGMHPQAADPDEMLDWCETHPEYWQEVK